MPDTSPRLPFEIDEMTDPSLVKGRAGFPVVIERFRQLGVAATIDAEIAVKQRQRSLPPAQVVESLIALWTSGADRYQDLTAMREDQALATLLGHPLPAATTVQDFLEALHVEDGPLWVASPEATISLESAPLAGLGIANPTLVAGLERGARETTATLDVDATLVESHSDAATVAYDGTRGYQPVALKRLTFPRDLRAARPKRLWFLLFNTVGKVVAHARRTPAHLSGALRHALLVRIRRKIVRLAPA